MKKAMTVLMVLLVAVLSISALTETHTVVLISVVNVELPEFAIRNTETGEVGKSVVYSTSKITEGDVRTAFDIIQTNNSNYFGNLSFTVSATELMAFVNGRSYSTEGVQVIMNGVACGNSATFTKSFQGATLAAGTTVESFEVLWNGNAALENATYEAAITLGYTAL